MGKATVWAGTALFASVMVLGACTEHHFEPPDREQQVAEAGLEFDLALFDTISWSSDEQKGLDGNVVYASYCRNCHGQLGTGDTEYAGERGLDVPSLVAADWEMADSPDAVLRRIFVGHSRGMPTWGVAGITPREMDAVTFYLLNVLRPEILQSDQGGAQP